MTSKIFRIKFLLRKRKFNRSSRVKTKSHLNFIINKEAAASLVTLRLAHFNTLYNFKYNRISIRNQFSRWGSCSRKGNLNFNFRIALLPSELADYIIVHELCHLGEFNHSKKFWNLVTLTIPNWQRLRNELRENCKTLFKEYE